MRMSLARLRCMRSFIFLGLLSLTACSTEPPMTVASPEPEARDDAGSTSDASSSDTNPADSSTSPDARTDAMVEAAKPAAWASGKEGASCKESCAALGKACAVACNDHRSCGAHDGVSGPYAGYACYYYEKKSGGTTWRDNLGRSLKSCDEVATYSWEHDGNKYLLGDLVANSPVGCCCQ